MRVGLIAEKIGMSRVYDEKGTFVPVTVLAVKDCKVVGLKKTDVHGYDALQIGFGEVKASRASKPILGFYKKIDQAPSKKILEFKVSEENLLEVGQKIDVSHFTAGQLVDVSGVSIGKGFAGVIKRHNFRSLRASHGVSLTHRSHGSTGNCQDPGRVFKGKKMAGHLGASKVTIQNLQIVDLDLDKNIILVKGAVPGHKGSLISIKDAVKTK